MKKRPKISVIIPVYNTEKYLKECLDSLINQTLREIEIICINDGSKDSSVEIVKEYISKDDRIKLFEEPTDCVSTMTFRIKHVIDEYYAEAEEVKRSTYSDEYMSFYGNLTVVIQSDNQDVFYDDQIIKVPAGKCMRQIGVYSDSYYTYPVVKLSK